MIPEQNPMQVAISRLGGVRSLSRKTGISTSSILRAAKDGGMRNAWQIEILKAAKKDQVRIACKELIYGAGAKR